MSDTEILSKFYNEAFPAVSYETRSKFISFLSRHEMDYKWLYSGALKNQISQGDVIGYLPIYFYDGEQIKKSNQYCPVIMLEHTCDMEVDDGRYRNEHYVYAPLFPFELIENKFKDTTALQINAISHKIFLGNIREEKTRFVADLNLINSITAKSLHEGIISGKFKRIVSLSDIGYLFFLAKLTVHFLRGEEKSFSN